MNRPRSLGLIRDSADMFVDESSSEFDKVDVLRLYTALYQVDNLLQHKTIGANDEVSGSIVMLWPRMDGQVGRADDQHGGYSLRIELVRYSADDIRLHGPCDIAQQRIQCFDIIDGLIGAVMQLNNDVPDEIMH